MTVSAWFYVASIAFAAGVGLLTYANLFVNDLAILTWLLFGGVLVIVAPLPAPIGVGHALLADGLLRRRWRALASVAMATAAYVVVWYLFSFTWFTYPAIPVPPPHYALPLVALMALIATPRTHRRGPAVFLVLSTASLAVLAASFWV